MISATLNKHYKTALMEATGHIGDSPLFLLDYVLRILRVIILMSLWQMILANKGSVDGLTLETVLVYTFLAEVFRQQMECRGSGMEPAIWDGSIANRFLRPAGVFSQFVAQMFGRWFFEFLFFSIPLLLLSPLFGVSILPSSPVALGLFVMSLALAIAVGLAIELIFGAMVVLTSTVYILYQIRDAVTTLLSGALLPLAFYPWGLGEVFGWLPFASMASAPLRIYTETGDPGHLILLQVIWAAVLWPIAHVLWRINREKLVSHGG